MLLNCKYVFLYMLIKEKKGKRYELLKKVDVKYRYFNKIFLFIEFILLF